MMTILSKRATVYFEPEIHTALKLMAVETSQSISDIINNIMKNELREDNIDLGIFDQREKEPSISFQSFVQELKANGKI